MKVPISKSTKINVHNITSSFSSSRNRQNATGTKCAMSDCIEILNDNFKRRALCCKRR